MDGFENMRGVCLPLRVARERIAPAEIIPDAHWEGEGEYPWLARKHAHEPVGAWALNAPLAGVKFEHHLGMLARGRRLRARR